MLWLCGRRFWVGALHRQMERELGLGELFVRKWAAEQRHWAMVGMGSDLVVLWNRKRRSVAAMLRAFRQAEDFVELMRASISSQSSMKSAKRRRLLGVERISAHSAVGEWWRDIGEPGREVLPRMMGEFVGWTLARIDQNYERHWALSGRRCGWGRCWRIACRWPAAQRKESPVSNAAGAESDRTPRGCGRHLSA